MRSLGLSFLLLILTLPVYGQSLQPGDIAIVGVNADNPDEFAFAALVDIPAGTVIGFVDHGWLSAGEFRATEDEFFYIAPETISRGTVITVDDVDGSPRFSTSGDQLFAFQGTVEAPEFLYGVNFEGPAVWQDEATSSNTSSLPNTLVNGTTAVAVEECVNTSYSGVTTGSREELLALIGDAGNWVCSGTGPLAAVSSFTVTGVANSIPEFDNPTLTADVVVGEQLSIQYTASDADSDPITYNATGLPAGASLDANNGHLMWTPTEDQVGSYDVQIEASDGMATASITLEIIVVSASDASRPIFTMKPQPSTARAGQEVVVPFLAEDPEAGALTYEVAVPLNTDGAELVDTEFHWTPQVEPGIYVFTLIATDPEGLSATENIIIAVQGTVYPTAGDPASTYAEISANFTPSSTLGYDVARDTLYSVISVDDGGNVCGVYTAFCVPLTDGDPSTVMFNAGINAEHVWPQSMGAGEEPQRSDLHILYPAKANVNSSRSNDPYAEIPDTETNNWFYLDQTLTTTPAQDIELYSESSGDRFEPRESVKGDVARAALYFYTMYRNPANEDFFDSMHTLLLDWDAQDPVSPEEILRNHRIAQQQTFVNPFILDTNLSLRIYGQFTAVEEPDVPAAFKLASVYPNPAYSTLTVRYQISTPERVGVSIFDVLGRRVLMSSAQATVGVRQEHQVDVSGIASGVYVVQVHAGDRTDRRIITLR